MKELSIEEKAQRYDETLEKATALYRASEPMSGCNVIIETLFPELKESEDERIRKELLEHCKNQAEPYIQTGNKCPQIQSWIAWLEKQGEQKPIDESKIKPKFKTGDRVIGIVSGMPYFITEVCDDHYNTESGCIIMFCSQDNFELYEQKPAEWSEEDEYTLGETTQHLEELIRIDKAKHCGCDVQYYQRDIDWLKSLKDRVQPKREWDEEDENRFNNLCWLIDQSDENEPTKNGFKNWLKYRALPQPKQEWSEEDEKHRLNCLSYFNMIEKTSPYYEDYLWLKSLRNNKNGYSNS